MFDVYLDWGGDLSVGSSGDLAMVTGTIQINQRVMRRLLTNPGGYIWNLDFGAGLGAFVGSTSSSLDIEAVIRNQILLEPAVPSTPTPEIAVRNFDATAGSILAEITFADPSTGSTTNLKIAVR